MIEISAKTILRSENENGKVLSTFLLRYPRWIHAELMAHRALSRNAASSRAIPVEKLINDVEANPAFPIYWGVNQKGMQAGEELSEAAKIAALDAWKMGHEAAITAAKYAAMTGAHKQNVNRLLEPFAHITVLVSATEWDNFLELRDHPDAEPHIQHLAREVRKLLEDDSTIQELSYGEWHLPFVDTSKATGLQNFFYNDMVITVDDAIKLSVARCASTSYKTVDGFDMTLENAQRVSEKLLGSHPIHASPAEHVAQADSFNPEWNVWSFPNTHGNFIGFSQYRHLLNLNK